MAVRSAIPDFQLANYLYAGATVTFWTVDGDGAKTATAATLYDAATGTDTLENPVTLDGEGKFSTVPYVEVPVIGSVTDLAVSDHDTGIITVPGRWRGDWVTATIYYAGEFVQDPDWPYNVYQVDETHTSGTLATDISNGLLTLAIDVETVALELVTAIAERFNFDSTITMADPGTGDIRLNNATLSSVTQVAISATNAGGSDVSDFIVTWDDSTTTGARGVLRIVEPGTTNWVVFTISGAVTDNTTWLQIPVTYVAKSGSFSNADKLTVAFSRSGDAGAVTGPASSTDNALARWDGAGGTAVQNSGWTLDDSDALSAGGKLKMSGKQVLWSKGADITPAANVLTPGTDGNYFDVGAGNFTSIATLGGDGTTMAPLILLQFDGACTITAHATDLVLPGTRNITTAAGDHAIFEEYAAGKWRLVSYQKASGNPLWIEETLVVALSDETTAITTGTAKVTIRMPWALTLYTVANGGVKASLSTASSSGNPAIDINEGGVSIFSTTLTIDANEKTSTTAATAAVLSDVSLADDAEITFDIDTAGTGAKGLKVTLRGYRAG